MPRLVVVCAVLAVATFLVFCYGMTLGDYPIGLRGVVSALAGSGDRGGLFVVRELRLPRALVGLLAGVAFGMSGALFQTLTRNPLASPDMIGINAGAAAAVVTGIALGFGVGAQVLGLAGGLVAAVLIYTLAWRRGTTGYRIVLVGIGVSAMCTGVTNYLISRAQLYQAQQALGWLLGNLNGRGWEQVRVLALAVAVLVPVTVCLYGWLRTLQLGDDVAAGLGTPVHTARLTLMLAGVGLVAFATAAAGPVMFVALAAPQIAKRLAGRPAPPPLVSGLTGAFIVLASDLAARRILPAAQLPVGVVTGVLGAPLLLWLLVRANRSGVGG